jgi:glycosyltransferase involved in cell wall biosynthesis
MDTYPSAGLIYKNNDPVDLSKKIKLLANNRELLVNFKRNSLKLAIEKLNWEIESRKFLDSIELFSSRIVE